MTGLESPVQKEIPGPGAIILYAREQLGISSEDLAAELKITKHKLSLIESNQFELAGTETFVRGYLRNAARVLQLDIDILLAEYDAYCELDSPNRDKDTQTEVVAAQSRNKSKLILIVPLFLLLLLGFWFFGQQEKPSQKPSLVQAQNSGVETSSAITANNLSASRSNESLGQSMESGAGANEQATAIKNTSLEVKTPNTEPAEASTEAAIVESPSPIKDTVVSAEPNISTEVSPDTAVTALSDGEQSLVFTFTDSCWLQVRDATGRRLFSNTKQAGQELRLQGQAPFRMNFGNVRAVSLTIDGEAVPLQAKAGRKTLAVTIP
ncbi:RodZ domain-containing protein [uncultured Pseudoteredinibacter sp.]|uniref:RodZ domain-containing protein n=1 Tax=uncultured Pseudoteredinibacter sp. TaxID=1641701 RepID=UPI00261D9107|nr:RodZ domain-containing protein [uncultured Pseudoteredinibacter sp.]